MVLGSPQIERGLLRLHRAVDFPELWNSLQRLLETVAPHDTMVMSVNYLDWRKEVTSRRLTSANSRVIDDKNAYQLIAGEGSKFFQPFLDQNIGIPCYHHTQVMEDPRKIPQTGFYRRYMTPLGWRYSAHLLFWRGREVETSFALRRRPDQGDFTEDEMACLRGVHPHIAVAFERTRIFEGERRRRRLLERFYRANPEAVLFLDWNLNVLYASQEAIALCAAWNLGPDRARIFTPQAVFAVPPELTEGCEELKPRWRDAGAGIAEAEPAPVTAEIVASRPGYSAAITLRRESGGTLTKPIFVIRLRGPEALLSVQTGQEHMFGQLTPAERELARLVCTGLTNKEVAARLKRSEGSVRVQLSGVFQKLQVSNRVKLMLALRS